MTPQEVQEIKTRQPAVEIAQQICIDIQPEASDAIVLIKAAIDNERAIIESLLGEVERLQSDCRRLTT